MSRQVTTLLPYFEQLRPREAGAKVSRAERALPTLAGPYQAVTCYEVPVMAAEQSTPWFGDRKAVLARVLSWVEDGTLSIDVNGRVWRHFELRRRGRVAVPVRRAENKAHKGYLAITIHQRDSGRSVTRSVLAHVLVWVAAKGPIPDGMQINHKDLNKANNDLDNLELVTGAENIRHSYANGRPHPFDHRKKVPGGNWRPGVPLITAERKEVVFTMRASGATYAQIVAATGISMSHIARILKGGRK